MYPYPPVTAELIRQQMQRVLEGYAKGPMPDEYWYQPEPTKPKWSWLMFWHRPKVQTEEVFGGDVCKEV